MLIECKLFLNNQHSHPHILVIVQPTGNRRLYDMCILVCTSGYHLDGTLARNVPSSVDSHQTTCAGYPRGMSHTLISLAFLDFDRLHSYTMRHFRNAFSSVLGFFPEYSNFAFCKWSKVV